MRNHFAMRTLFRVGLSLWLCCHVSAPCAQEADATQLAMRFMSAAQRGDVAMLDQMESDLLRSRLDGTGMARLWAGLQQRFGAGGPCGSKASGNKGAHDTVVLACAFEHATVDVHLTVAEGRIAGVFLGQVQSARRDPPPSSKARERELRIGAPHWMLPATLSLPANGEALGAAVLVHGSGPLDRNSTVGQTQLFKDLAAQLANAGIASLRYEKRTRHHAIRLAQQLDVTLEEETIDDARAALSQLANVPELSDRCIYLIGHSLGAYLAPRIAADQPRLTGLVLLAPPGRKMVDVVLDQVEFLLDETAGREGTEGLLRDQERRLSALKKEGLAAKELPGPWRRSAWTFFDAYDPLREWSANPMHTLAVFAGKDYQVTAKDMQAWRAVAQRFPAELRIEVLPGVGHVFTAVAGRPSPASYLVEAEATPALADLISGFVRESCRNARQGTQDCNQKCTQSSANP